MVPVLSTASNPNPKHERIDLVIYSVLIEHPTAGLILFETGCHDDMEAHWGPVSPFCPVVLHHLTSTEDVSCVSAKELHVEEQTG